MQQQSLFAIRFPGEIFESRRNVIVIYDHHHTFLHLHFISLSSLSHNFCLFVLLSLNMRPLKSRSFNSLSCNEFIILYEKKKLRKGSKPKKQRMNRKIAMIIVDCNLQIVPQTWNETLLYILYSARYYNKTSFKWYKPILTTINRILSQTNFFFIYIKSLNGKLPVVCGPLSIDCAVKLGSFFSLSF